MIVTYVGFKMKLVEAAMEKEETLGPWSCQNGLTYYIGSMNWRIILPHHLQILDSRSSLLKSMVFSLYFKVPVKWYFAENSVRYFKEIMKRFLQLIETKMIP